METSLVAAVALLLVLVGAVTVLARQRLLPWSLPAPEASGAGAGGDFRDRTEPAETAALASEVVVAASPHTPLPAAHPTIFPGPARRAAGQNQEAAVAPGFDPLPDAPAAVTRQLDRFEARLEELSRAIDRQGVDIRRALEEQRSNAAADATREIALERLRADVVSAVSGAASNRGPQATDRRAEVSAELYARLARLEAALAAVTNPILLPGEVYIPPAELMPEALVWENWNEVGERAFALADGFSAQRLHLSEQTRADVGEFVTELRVLLTSSVYPNLQPEPAREQQLALRAALEAIAAGFPRVRDTIEQEFRESRL